MTEGMELNAGDQSTLYHSKLNLHLDFYIGFSTDYIAELIIENIGYGKV